MLVRAYNDFSIVVSEPVEVEVIEPISSIVTIIPVGDIVINKLIEFRVGGWLTHCCTRRVVHYTSMIEHY